MGGFYPIPASRGRIAAVLGAAAVLAALLLAADSPERARAAPCQAPDYAIAAGNLSIVGTTCDFNPELFRVFCSAGTVQFEYRVNGSLVGVFDTTTACGAPSRLTVTGNGGEDTIDLSAVTAAAGFTAINQPNTLDGGYQGDILIGSALPDSVLGGPGPDIVLLRDGAADSADCGDDIDAAQADRATLDALSNCEVADVLPAPAAKKCKKRKGRKGAAAKKCRKPKRRHA